MRIALAIAALPLAIAVALVSPAAATTVPAGFQESMALGGLEAPVAVEFAPGGRVFVAEKSGLIKTFDNLDDPTPTIFADLRTEVHNYGDRGLEGLVLDPNYQTNPYVYIYYVHDAPIGGTAPVWGNPGETYDGCPPPPAGPGDLSHGCVVSGRLSRLRGAGAVSTGPEQVLIEDWCQQYSSHAGGGMEFGADGYLYLAGGEGASLKFWDYGQDGDPQNDWHPINPCGDPPAGVDGVETPPTAEGGRLRAQDLRTSGDPTGLSGSLIRVDPATGAGVPGNPQFSSSDPNVRRMLAYGLRNPFRLAVRPGSNDVYMGDVQTDFWDEINRVPNPTDPIRNFGWPCYEGALDSSGNPYSKRLDSSDALNLNICESLYADGTASPPFWAYDQRFGVVPGEDCETSPFNGRPVGTVISALAFYPLTGPFPAQYRGALFFGDYARQCIWAMLPGSDGLPDRANIQNFVGHAGFPVDLATGPGGDLYYVDVVDGEIRRVHYTGNPSNHVPTAVASAAPSGGDVPLAVSFDGTGSSDPDPGDTLAYAWDLDGDGQFDDSTAARPTHTYTTPGVYHVKLRVTDTATAFDVDSITINAGSGPPTASIDSPTAAHQWFANEQIGFSGSATDPEDGSLPASALDWLLVLHHCTAPSACHTHTLQGFDNTSSGSFPAPDHGYPSYLELRLTATDSDANTDTTSLRLDPMTANYTFLTSPPGLQLLVGDTLDTAPFVRQLISKSTTFVSAPSPQTVGGVTYRFAAWSDGQAASHTLVGSSESTTRTARFAAVLPGTQTLTFAPEGDVYAAESAPDGNLGISWVLRTAANTSADGEAYLRFLVDGLVGRVESAKLRLFATKDTVDGPQVFLTSNSWSELGLTWNNRPPPIGGPIADVGAMTAGTWVEWDVTSAMTGAGPFSFRLANTGTDAAKFDSRESPEGLHRPNLVITTVNDAYARPKGATPTVVSLVPAYEACASPNTSHGGPLAYPSCRPPRPSSSQITVGTPDTNGAQANSIGVAGYGTTVGNPATPQDEADVFFNLTMSDVRKADVSDYGGELGLRATFRVTDRGSAGAQNLPGTVMDLDLPAAVPCAPTASTGIGAQCSLNSTVEALVPGAVREGARSVWELGQVEVLDGGPDGDPATDPNTSFARQGLFVP